MRNIENISFKYQSRQTGSVILKRQRTTATYFRVAFSSKEVVETGDL
jgi:hypothetical protein